MDEQGGAIHKREGRLVLVAGQGAFALQPTINGFRAILLLFAVKALWMASGPKGSIR